MPVWTVLRVSLVNCRPCRRYSRDFVLDNVGTDGGLEDIGERVASLAGLAVGGDDGNRGSAGHFGGRRCRRCRLFGGRERTKTLQKSGCAFSLSSAKILASQFPRDISDLPFVHHHGKVNFFSLSDRASISGCMIIAQAECLQLTSFQQSL